MRWLKNLIQFRVEYYSNGPDEIVTRHEWLGPFFSFGVLRTYEGGKVATDYSFTLHTFDPRL